MRSTCLLSRPSATHVDSAPRVGSVEHPSLPEHYIEWIALEAEGRLEVHYLEPGMKPATFFAGGSKTGTVYAYCNLHGLWSATF